MTSLFPVKVGSEDMLGEGLGGGGRGCHYFQTCACPVSWSWEFILFSCDDGLFCGGTSPGRVPSQSVSFICLPVCFLSLYAGLSVRLPVFLSVYIYVCFVH